jgi:hypothetical protein
MKRRRHASATFSLLPQGRRPFTAQDPASEPIATCASKLQLATRLVSHGTAGGVSQTANNRRSAKSSSLLMNPKALSAAAVLSSLCSIFLAPTTAVAQASSQESSHLSAATYDGTWSGAIKCLYSPGRWPDDECGTALNFEIHGNSIKVEQIVRSKSGKVSKSQINTGRFHFERLAANAVATSMDSQTDEDGTWVETWSFAMTLKDPRHMIVHWTRIVNNLGAKNGSEFSVVGMGEVVRSEATNANPRPASGP